MANPPRVLVTGAEGFVGRWLIRALVSDLPPGSEIVAGSRQEALVEEPGRVRPIVLDVTDRAGVRAAVAAIRPSGVVHLAAIASVPQAGRDTRLAWSVNLHGTMNVAEAVRDEAPEARLVFAGTSEAYGGTFVARDGPLDETAPLDPANAYAASKAAADLLLGQMAREGLGAVRMRPFNHTGPGQGEDYAIPAFAAQIARIEAGSQPPVLRVGNLDARRDFLDVRDVVRGYVLALTRPGIAPGAIFHLASGRPVRIGDALETLLGFARVRIRVEQDPGRLRPSDIPVTIGSARRAGTELGWAPTIPFARTLGDVLDGWRDRLGARASG